MPGSVDDLPADVRRKVSRILCDYSGAMTEAQRDLVEGNLTACARKLERAANKLIQAAKLIREG